VRILYLHQYFLTPEMAGGTRSFEMARRFVEAGHDVQMITTDQHPSPGAPAWRETIEQGIHVHWARVPYDNELGFARRVAAFFRFALRAAWRAGRLGGDVLLATSTPLTIVIPALIVSRWRRIPFVFEVRDMWPDVPIAIGALRNPVLVWMARRLESAAYRRAAAIVVLSPGMRDDIADKGVPAGKITIVPNGCDVDIFASPRTGTAPRERFAWLGQRRLVLFAGTFGRLNGLDYLVRLASEVRGIDPEIRFVAIGAGRDWLRVRELAATSGVLDRTFFIFPAMPKRELAAWVQTADLMLALFGGPRAVWKDACTNKLFDAIAAGTPTACNFDGWQARMAAEAGVGLTLDQADASVAARQLVDILGDRQWLAGVPERARMLAPGRFNRQRLADQALDVLAAAAGTRTREVA
jgi:glycosyltransferase involved in cell wall biosynthesis